MMRNPGARWWREIIATLIGCVCVIVTKRHRQTYEFIGRDAIVIEYFHHKHLSMEFVSVSCFIFE